MDVLQHNVGLVVLLAVSIVFDKIANIPLQNFIIMTPEKVDQFMLCNSKYFRQEQLFALRNTLIETDDSKWPILSTMQFKDPTIAIILSILVGGLGVDRFYIGDTGLGIGKLVTLGGLGIWAFIDFFLIMGAAKDKNLASLNLILHQ